MQTSDRRSSSDNVPTPRKSLRKEKLTPTVLRRSTRKRSNVSSVFSSPPPSAKKARKIVQTPPVSPPVPPPTLLSLPYCAIIKLLLYLDVDSLENMSSTCSYFDLLIAGRFLLSIDFPFPVDFIKEVTNVDTLEKKPLLRIRCKKSRKQFQVFPTSMSDDSDDDESEPVSFHKLTVENCPHMTDYIIMSQMSLLSLHKLREVDLVPNSVKQDGNKFMSQRYMDLYSNFDCSLLKQIRRLGSLANVTKLDVLVDQNFFLEKFMSSMPNLLELGLSILTRNGLCKYVYMNQYLPRLEAVVSACKAPILKVTVVNETKRNVMKVLKNSYVEKLTVTGPCTFNIFPVMENLKEVVVNLETTSLINCTYWKSKLYDRHLHRAGLCCVHVGVVYENCPKLERFKGVDVASIGHDQSFNKWNTRMKKKFYDHYLSQGGLMEMKPWAKARWFSRKVVLPKDIGHNRIPQNIFEI